MNIPLYLLIIFIKTIEISLTTLRIKLITKGEKLKGALVGFVEITMWLYVIAEVLGDITNDIFKVFAYALGFAMGNYFGMVLESKLGLGTIRMEVITKEEDGLDLAKNIRNLGYAVTVLNGHGMNYERNVLLIVVKRKMVPGLLKKIKEYQHNAFITITETEPIYGGFGSFLKK